MDEMKRLKSQFFAGGVAFMGVLAILATLATWIEASWTRNGWVLIVIIACFIGSALCVGVSEAIGDIRGSLKSGEI
jgi:uncharacterized membrane protein YcjF (UPF0283 family)